MVLTNAEPPGPARRSGRTARVWAPVVAMIGIAAVLGLVVPLAMHRTADPAGAGSPTGTPPTGAAPTGGDPAARNLPPDSGSGVPVEGMGALLRDRTGMTVLCAEVSVTADLPTSSAGCTSISVPVTGVDPAWLAHTTTTGQAFSEPVRVEGVFRAGTLVVNLVEHQTPGPVVAPDEPQVPCPPPPGGWRPDYGLDPAASGRQQVDRLRNEVSARPERYTDIWVGYPAGRPTGEDEALRAAKVMVVGTTGDVARDRVDLAAIFPGNLCVHPVRYSAADLAAIAERLRSVRFTSIQAEPDVMRGTVRVKVVALDPATVAVLDEVGRDALTLEEPMLQWLD